MTVTVEIEGQIYVGSAIQRMQMNYDAERGQYDGYAGTLLTTSKHSNEAVVINLGEHGYLFSLWEYVYPTRIAKSYPTEYPKGPPRLSDREEKNVNARAKAYHNYLDALAHPSNYISLKDYPEFVRFEDITDPTTFETFRTSVGSKTAKTYHDTKRFKAAYGPTARVVSVVVENTENPIVFGQIDKVFGPHFFTEWRIHAHGTRQSPGPCSNHSSEYSKRNRSYCRASKVIFQYDQLRLRDKAN